MTKRDEDHSTIIGTRLQHPWSMIRNRPFGHLLPVPSTSSVGIGLGPVSRMRCKDNHHVSRSGTSSHQKDDGWCSKEKIKRITGRSNSPRETKAEEKKMEDLRICPSCSLQAITIIWFGLQLFYCMCYSSHRYYCIVSCHFMPLFWGAQNPDFLKTNCQFFGSRCCTHDDPKFCVRALTAWCCFQHLSALRPYKDMRQVRILNRSE